jgi:hypothetical protein
VAEAQELGALPDGLELNASWVNDVMVAANNRTLWVAIKAKLMNVPVKGLDSTKVWNTVQQRLSRRAIRESAMNLREALAAKKSEYEQYVIARRMEPETFLLTREILELERAIAKEEGGTYLDEIDIRVERDGFQDCPFVITDCSNCFLVLKTKSQQLALVGFRGIGGYRVLALGDDDAEGHPLAGKGLRPYGVFEVMNSTWSDEINAIRDKRVMYSASTRRITANHHYFIYFKARTFEVLSDSFSVLGTFPTQAEAYAHVLTIIGKVQ